MSVKKITLAVVFTAGFDGDSPVPAPSHIGRLRIEKAAHAVDRDRTKSMMVCFAGGARSGAAKSEAEVYAQYFCARRESLAGRVFLVSPKAAHTAESILALSREIMREAAATNIDVVGLILVGHPYHTQLAKITFIHAGQRGGVKTYVEELSSGEPAPHSHFKHAGLVWVTKNDPAHTDTWFGRRVAEGAAKR